LDELKKEIVSLIDRLEKSDRIDNAVENQAVSHLKRLIGADEKALGIYFAHLKQFWTTSVDWCSELSKQLEKLIIIYEDSVENENRSSLS
jgi:hypothetical protein